MSSLAENVDWEAGPYQKRMLSAPRACRSGAHDAR